MKKIDGQCRQIIKLENYHYVIEYVKKEIHIFDNKFQITEIQFRSK